MKNIKRIVAVLLVGCLAGEPAAYGSPFAVRLAPTLHSSLLPVSFTSQALSPECDLAFHRPKNLASSFLAREIALRKRYTGVFPRFVKLWQALTPERAEEILELERRVLGKAVRFIHIPEGEDYTSDWLPGETPIYLGSPEFLTCMGILVRGPRAIGRRLELLLWHYRTTLNQDALTIMLGNNIEGLRKKGTKIVIARLGGVSPLDAVKMKEDLGVNTVAVIPYHDKTRLDLVSGFDAISWAIQPWNFSKGHSTGTRRLSVLPWDDVETRTYASLLPRNAPPNAQPSGKLKGSGAGLRIEPGQGEERNHRISDARFAAEMGFSNKYEVRRNTGFDNQNLPAQQLSDAARRYGDRITSAIAELKTQGLPYTSKDVAEALGIAYKTLANNANRVGLHMADLPFQSEDLAQRYRDRIMSAIDELKAKELPYTRRAVAERMGIQYDTLAQNTIRVGLKLADVPFEAEEGKISITKIGAAVEEVKKAGRHPTMQAVATQMDIDRHSLTRFMKRHGIDRQTWGITRLRHRLPALRALLRGAEQIQRIFAETNDRLAALQKARLALDPPYTRFVQLNRKHPKWLEIVGLKKAFKDVLLLKEHFATPGESVGQFNQLRKIVDELIEMLKKRIATQEKMLKKGHQPRGTFWDRTRPAHVTPEAVRPLVQTESKADAMKNLERALQWTPLPISLTKYMRRHGIAAPWRRASKGDNYDLAAAKGKTPAEIQVLLSATRSVEEALRILKPIGIARGKASLLYYMHEYNLTAPWPLKGANRSA